MKNIDEYFTEENLKPNREEIFTENGKYFLEIRYYKVGTPEDHYWNFSRGRVFNAKTKELLFDIKRNYSAFWYLFIEHPNGNDYLICGRDYHGGYNIFDLTNKKEYANNPAHEPYRELFCWVDVKFDLDTQTLLVEGCYWACTFEIVTFDFHDPTKLPLTEISRKEVEYEEEEDE
jgi:hypothetical protein